MSETVNYRGREIEIWNDECAFNPRENCNVTTMVCFHNSYSLGDENHGYSQSDYNSWEELAEAIQAKEDPMVIMPLYLYDHSGITISTGSFSCRWDSGQIGFAFVSKKKMKEEFGDESSESTQKWLKEYHKGKTIEELAEYWINAEVKEYDKYITGECYGFTVEDDSCGGFLGYDHEESGLLDEARSQIDYILKSEMEERIQKVKNWIINKVPLGYRELPKLI